MPKIDYKATGFLERAEYSFHFSNFFEDYQDKFGGAEKIEVTLEEVPYTMLAYMTKYPKNPITISDEGKNVKIEYRDWQYHNAKGKVTKTPSQQDVFRGLKHLMDRAVAEYSSKFPNDEEQSPASPSPERD